MLIESLEIHEKIRRVFYVLPLFLDVWIENMSQYWLSFLEFMPNSEIKQAVWPSNIGFFATSNKRFCAIKWAFLSKKHDKMVHF